MAASVSSHFEKPCATTGQDDHKLPIVSKFESGFLSFWLGLWLWLMTATCHAEIAVQMTPAQDPYLLVWARNDQLLISRSDRGLVHVWETATGRLLQTLRPGGEVADVLTASPDGEWIGTLVEGRAAIINRKTRAVAWASREFVVAMTDLTSSSVTLAFTGRAARIQWPGGKVLAEWKAPSNSTCASIHSLSQGRSAVCLSGRTTYILNRDLLETAMIAPQKPDPFYFSHSSSQGAWISLCTFQGAHLANADEPERGFQVIKSLRGRTFLPSPDGNLWFGGATGRWAVYDRDGNSLTALALLEDVFEEGVAWSADGGTLAVPSSDGIQLIDARTGVLIRKFGVKHLGSVVLDAEESTALSSAGLTLAMRTPTGDRSILDCRKPLEWKSSFVAAPPQPSSKARIDSLILSKQGGWHRYENGRLEPLKIRQSSSVFDIQSIGDSLWLRSNDEMTVHSFGPGREALNRSFPLSVVKCCEASPDAQWALHQSQDERQLMLRRAPNWQVVAEFTVPKGQPRALLASADGSEIGWIDSERRWWSYGPGSAAPQHKLTVPGNGHMDWFTHSSAPNLAVGWRVFTSPFNGVVIDAKGQVKHQIRSWRHFTDEIDLFPLGFGPSQKHLWLCGSGARPILVDLALGQPLLRLHYFADGVALWEMASGKFFGPEAAKAYLRWSDLYSTRALSASELAAVWSERALSAVLNAYLNER
jgi:WD40 repeat protein